MSAKAENQSKLDVYLQRVSWGFGIILGVIGVILTICQININEELVKKNKLSDQPIFLIHIETQRSEGSEMNDYVKIWIENQGEKPRRITTPTITTYLKFIYISDIGEPEQTFFVPIRNYFDGMLTTYNLSGSIASTYTLLPNNEYFMRVHQEAIDSIRRPAMAFVEMVYITKIDYIDKYEETQTIYFINETEEDILNVKNIEKQSRDQFEYQNWAIYKLSLSKLIDICGIDTTQK